MPRDVFGCYLHPGRLEASFVSSLARLKTDRLIGGQMWAKPCASGGIFAGRNDLTARFLASPAEWMWTVDADMGFGSDTLTNLLVTADLISVPMVGALCFSWPIVRADGMGGYFNRPQPTIYHHDGAGYKAVTDYPRGRIVRAYATGAACLLIHRSVMEQVREEHGENWWTPLRDGRSEEWLGEDLSFFLRANPDGTKLAIDTTIKTTHAKTIYLSEEHFSFWPKEAPC